MKPRYRLFLRRKSIYYAFDNTTKRFSSLKTKDKAEANRLLTAMNEPGRQAGLYLSLARIYFQHFDPQIAKRTWQTLMDEMTKTKTGAARHRYETAMQDKAFDVIRKLPILETRPTHFLKVLELGTVPTNAHLRRIHDFALVMNWLPWPILSRKQWPKVQSKKKRTNTLKKHQMIIIPSLEEYEKRVAESQTHQPCRPN